MKHCPRIRKPGPCRRCIEDSIVHADGSVGLDPLLLPREHADDCPNRPPFRVVCDETTNPPEVTASGRINGVIYLDRSMLAQEVLDRLEKPMTEPESAPTSPQPSSLPSSVLPLVLDNGVSFVCDAVAAGTHTERCFPVDLWVLRTDEEGKQRRARYVLDVDSVKAIE